MISEAQRNADVLICPADYENRGRGYWSGRVAVIIDVLRATSTMVTALSEGHAWVLTAREVEDARRQALLYPDAVLAGERGGLPPAGFSRGNSPLEFIRKSGIGEGIILSTTNGTRAIEAASGASEMVLGSFLNLKSTLDFLQEQACPVTFVCSGTGEDFALEDALLAGAFLDSWQPEHAMASLYRAYAGRLDEAFRSSSNGRRLVGLGLEADITWCLQRDCYNGVIQRNPETGRFERRPC